MITIEMVIGTFVVLALGYWLGQRPAQARTSSALNGHTFFRG